ncbi:MAG: hypothetical protein ACRDBO_14700 [Lachnospiraceae bacterium]
MNLILEKFFSDGYALAISFSATLISCIWGFYSHFKNQSKKRILCNVKTVPIINKNREPIDGLSILYNDIQLNDLYSIQIEFVNVGSLIKANDIAQKAPLEILYDRSSFISFNDIEDNANNYTLEATINSDSIKLYFDFMNKDDSVVLNILSSSPDIDISGKIIGGQLIVNKTSPEIEIKQLKENNTASIMAALIGMVGTITTAIISFWYLK